MIRPPPRFTMWGPKALKVLAVPGSLVSIVMLQSESSISSSGWKPSMPALANRTSTSPNSCLTLAAASRNAGRLRVSIVMPNQRRPASRTSLPVSSRSSGVDGVTAGTRVDQRTDIGADDVRALPRHGGRSRAADAARRR